MFEYSQSELAYEIVSLLMYLYRGQETDITLPTHHVCHRDAVAEQHNPVILLAAIQLK